MAKTGWLNLKSDQSNGRDASIPKIPIVVMSSAAGEADVRHGGNAYRRRGLPN